MAGCGAHAHRGRSRGPRGVLECRGGSRLPDRRRSRPGRAPDPKIWLLLLSHDPWDRRNPGDDRSTLERHRRADLSRRSASQHSGEHDALDPGPAEHRARYRHAHPRREQRRSAAHRRLSVHAAMRPPSPTLPRGAGEGAIARPLMTRRTFLLTAVATGLSLTKLWAGGGALSRSAGEGRGGGLLFAQILPATGNARTAAAWGALLGAEEAARAAELLGA